jgi:pimeloyl-ACP methyl ester carboxylesterase
MGARVSHRDIHFTSPDGLSLYARDHMASGNATPLLCLSGLTRNCRDFEPLVGWLGGIRRIITMDYRGRGRSAYAPDPATYRPDVELGDALRLLDTLGIEKASVIGASRGGIIAMLMAVRFPGRLVGVLLNDVGPAIEPASLIRIRSYLGKAIDFANWSDAATALAARNSGFDNLTGEEWIGFARRVFIERQGRIVHDYDLRLAEVFPTVEATQAASGPELWPQFEALKPFPVTVLRGENSDLLSATTVVEMRRRHPRLAAWTIGHRGHVPFLDEPDAQLAIRDWLKVA